MLTDATRPAVISRKPVYTPKGRSDGRVDHTKPGPCIQTKFDPEHPNAPVVETVKTGFETAAHLW